MIACVVSSHLFWTPLFDTFGMVMYTSVRSSSIVRQLNDKVDEYISCIGGLHSSVGIEYLRHGKLPVHTHLFKRDSYHIIQPVHVMFSGGR